MPQMTRGVVTAISIVALAAAGSLRATPTSGAGSPPTLEDIVGAKSIDGLSISPNGRWISYRVLAPDLRMNINLIQWYVVATDGMSPAVAVGPPSDPILYPEFDLLTDPEVLWTAASDGFVVRLQLHSQIQLYLLPVKGRWRQLTTDAADVQSVDVNETGTSILYQVRSPRAEIDARQAQQETAGIHFDRGIFPEGLPLTHNFRIGDRWTTIRRSEPPEDTDIGREAFAGPLKMKRLAPPSPMRGHAVGDNQKYIDPFDSAGLAHAEIKDPKGMRVRVLAGAGERLAPDHLTVEAILSDGSKADCRADACQGSFKALREITVNPDTGEAVILSEKDYSARSALWGWSPGQDTLRLIYKPDGAITGGANSATGPCPRNGHYLFCKEAGPTRPDRIIRIDLTSGETRELADPNAALAGRTFPQARYIEWNDASGRSNNGILMTPADGSAPAPLVITTYRCRGFLRGGVAMVVPEPILVQRGFATLCVNNNDAALEVLDAAGNRAPAAGAKAAMDSYSAIITKLAADRVVDPQRVGITGHSFSGNSVAYAISHSDLFAAAVIPGTTMDPMAYALTAPMADSSRKEVFSNMGLPAPDNDPKSLWKAISPALNASSIHARVLMQPPENEWLFSLQLYTAIRDAGGTVDMYIYPHAGHGSNRYPLHQYWRNRRSLDWFSYWLQPGEQRDLIDPEELKQWDAIRLHQVPSRDD